jgi:AraC-like DNA-binding protein
VRGVAEIASDRVVVKLIEQIRFQRYPLAGIDAMAAATTRAFPRHTHDQYGMGVIDSGGHASSSDRGQVEAGPGSLIFVNPGEVHDGRPIGRRPRSWRMLYLDPTLMEELRADVLDGANPSFTFAAPVFVDENLHRLFDAAFAHAVAKERHSDAMECETALLRLAARVEVNGTARSRSSVGPAPSIRRVRDRIDADLSARLTLAGLAGEVGLSRFQLLRGFARELGLTPHAYILQRRIALARRLIRAGRALAEAAVVAGFYDQSHLNRCFTRQFGVTPSRYASGTG